jgi:magnesium-transporting ATPase (P-type)
MHLLYSTGPLGLVACPFCRETFEKSEALTCPVCGLSLTAQDKLPLSHDAMAEGFVPTLPELEPKPFLYWKRNRGVLALIALLGIALFFMPWIDMKIPEERTISGFQLSRRHVQTWCVLVAWMVLAPTVLSRRSILKMRTARVTTAFLAAIPGLSIVLLALQRQKSAFYTISYTHTAAFWATLLLSVLGIAFSWKFGGPLDDIDVASAKPAGGRQAAPQPPSDSLH